MYLSANRPMPEHIKMIYAFRIRRHKIRRQRTLEWLFEHNDFWKRMRPTGHVRLSETIAE